MFISTFFYLIFPFEMNFGISNGLSCHKDGQKIKDLSHYFRKMGHSEPPHLAKSENCMQRRSRFATPLGELEF
jgi:hypothetical protein